MDEARANGSSHDDSNSSKRDSRAVTKSTTTTKTSKSRKRNISEAGDLSFHFVDWRDALRKFWPR